MKKFKLGLRSKSLPITCRLFFSWYSPCKFCCCCYCWSKMHMRENFLLYHLIIQMYILHWYKTAWLPEKKRKKNWTYDLFQETNSGSLVLVCGQSCENGWLWNFIVCSLQYCFCPLCSFGIITSNTITSTTADH